MPILLEATLIGVLAGVLGTGLGGFLTVILKEPKDTMLSALLAFSGGIMLALVARDLIPEALALGGLVPALSGLLLGVGLIRVLDQVLPDFNLSQLACNEKRKARFLRTGILLGIGIAMHNLPEGLAIGAGYMASEGLGIGLAIIIAIHNVPEGMAMGGPLKAARQGPLCILVWTGLAGLPMGIGTFIGVVMGSISWIFLSIALGFAAGAMLYIIFAQLLPDSLAIGKGSSTAYGAAAGILVGMLVLFLVHVH